MDFIDLITFYVLMSAATAQCPDLPPPDNGVLKCHQAATSVQCTATCYKDYVFPDNQHVKNASCPITTYSASPQHIRSNCIPSCPRYLLSTVTITASSTSADVTTTEPPLSSSAWRPEVDDERQFVQVDLGSLHRLDGWSLRGDGQGHYVSVFRLLFSNNSVSWEPYYDALYNEMFIKGNVDSVGEVRETLGRPQTARFVRINPVSWQGHIALHWDLLGCPLHHGSTSTANATETGDTGCRMPIPPAGGAINCEKNGTFVVCTAYCLQNQVFAGLGPAQDVKCYSDNATLLPPCVQGDTTNRPSTWINGQCLYEEHHCIGMNNGDYQYCGNCHYFSTCSEEYFFVRPCPAHLQYDSILNQCNYRSTTCNSTKPQTAVH